MMPCQPIDRGHTYTRTYIVSSVENIDHFWENMDQSSVTIDDLPDEILLVILSKLHHIEILCSMVGVSPKLDQIACDISFTRSLNTTNPSQDGISCY